MCIAGWCLSKVCDVHRALLGALDSSLLDPARERGAGGRVGADVLPAVERQGAAAEVREVAVVDHDLDPTVVVALGHHRDVLSGHAAQDQDGGPANEGTGREAGGGGRGGTGGGNGHTESPRSCRVLGH